MSIFTTYPYLYFYILERIVLQCEIVRAEAYFPEKYKSSLLKEKI